MVRHIVSWNFKPELSEEERRAAAETLVARMTALRDLVPCVERLEVFQPPIGLSNCDLCMYTEIDKEENLVVYRDHPELFGLNRNMPYFCIRFPRDGQP